MRLSNLQKIALIMFASAVIVPGFAAQTIRFSDAWKFYRGDAAGAQAAAFGDASWETVYLPHTAREELNYRTASIYMGVCWYRKSFTPPSSFKGKKMYIEFGAAMQSAQIWINGTSLTTHLGGYTPFVIEITGYVQFGSVNVIAARLDNNASASFPPGNADPDFLYFGGLYRDVHILVMDSLHITNAIFANIPGGGGVFVTYPAVSGASATVQVKTHVINEHALPQSCVVTTTILSESGAAVAVNSSPAADIEAGASTTFTQSLSVSNPSLWTPNTPYLYRVRSQVFAGGGSNPVDTLSTTAGIRSIVFSKAGGLQINGTRYRLRGCNRHMSYPYIGNAVPNSGQYRDALRMKEYGYDFVRMSHYMQAESFVDACDKLGIVGMACLPGWQYYNDAPAFRDNSIKALRDMIRSYRNHPSVMIYEAMHNESSPSSVFLKAAQAAAHEEYPGNQMFTCGEEDGNILDVYMSSAQHKVRDYSGSRACIISEYGDWEHGCAWADPITGCKCRIDRSAGEAALQAMAVTRAGDIDLNRACSWFTMDGVWTIFDYQSWSRGPYTASGDMDIFRIPKFPAYFNQGVRKPSVTGASLNSGLPANASGSSSQIKVVIDTASLRLAADGSDIAIVYASILGADGRINPAAATSVTFSLSGPGKLVGTNPAAAIAGIASILVRAGTTGGLITITGEASGLTKGSATVSSVATSATAVAGRSDALPQPRLRFFMAREIGGMPWMPAPGAPEGSLLLYDLQGRRIGLWNIDKGAIASGLGRVPKGVCVGRVMSGNSGFIKKSTTIGSRAFPF